MWFSYWLRCDWRGKKRPRVYRWSERNKPPSLGGRRWREDISVGWMKLSKLFHLLPSLTCPLFAPVWYLFHPQKSTADPAQVPKWSLSPFASFTSFLPLFACFCPTRSLFNFLQSTLLGIVFFLFALLTSPRGRGCSICWCRTDHNQHACSVILKMRWLK